MRFLLVLLACCALQATEPVRPHVQRSRLIALEKSFDGRLEHTGVPDPLLLLGNTRAIYLDGYGVVFSCEVNLVNSPNINPFKQSFTPAEKTRLRGRKLERVLLLKQTMRAMLSNAAATLTSLPPNEQIVLGVSLFYFSWEDTAGLPGQIVMRGQRQKVLAAVAENNAVQVEEF